MRHTLPIGALLLALLAAPESSAQQVPDHCGDPQCMVTQVNISTGYDHANATTYTPLAADAWWTLVDSPNTNLTVPSPPWVITPNPAWANFAGSQWISAYNTNANNLNNPSPQDPYSFERCICVCEFTMLHLDFDMLVDNVADVYFDNVLIASQTNPGSGSFTTPFPVDTFVQADVGEHCLRIDVRNLSGVAMGLNINGIIESVPPGSPIMLSPECCEQTGKIIVCKFLDADCDGVKDVPPVGVEGFTFTLTPSGLTAVTDASGYAYFEAPPGLYTLTESPKPGWTPSNPASGSQTVDVTIGSVQLVDFLNCQSPAAWVDLGCSLGGATGAPHLTATGTLEGGTTSTIDLTGAMPFSLAYLCITVGSMTPVPFKCGTLKAFPISILLTLPTDANGEIHFAIAWPVGFPAGISIYMQYVFPDPTAPCGFSMSNAICAATP